MFEPWQTVRERERDFDKRGMKEDSYVATNGSVQESSQGNGFDIWKPALAGLDITAVLTPGTTLLSIYNNDNVIVPGSNVYGDIVLNRPMFVDEIGVRLIPTAGNFKDYRLSANVLWLDQGADWDKGTCEEYWMNNLNVDEGYGGGGLETLCGPPGTFIGSGISVGMELVGGASGATMTVTSWTDDCVTGTVVGGPFQVGELVTPDFFPLPEFTVISYTIHIASNRLAWSPDRLYNAAVGPPEQEGFVPVGHGPNAFVAYADANGEAVGVNCVRPLVPIISDSAESPGTFRPPKDSFIIDPGQSIAIQVQGLYVPPAGFATVDAGNTAQLVVDTVPAPNVIVGEVITGATSGAIMTVTQIISTTQFVGTMSSGVDFRIVENLTFSGGAIGIKAFEFHRLLEGAAIAASGQYSIAAWIRFRQPLYSEPYDWDKLTVPEQWAP